MKYSLVYHNGKQYRSYAHISLGTLYYNKDQMQMGWLLWTTDSSKRNRLAPKELRASV